jgi:hypothetical protein
VPFEARLRVVVLFVVVVVLRVVVLFVVVVVLRVVVLFVVVEFWAGLGMVVADELSFRLRRRTSLPRDVSRKSCKMLRYF